MNRFKELNKRTIKWADEKGILKNATPLTQIEKTEEEVAETKLAIFASKQELFYFYNSKGERKNAKHEIKDGIGDTLVTLLIQCKMQGLDPLDCLETALNVIEQRTGKMIKGKFVKDS